MKMDKKYVRCISSDIDNFVPGKFYRVIGDNNGIQILDEQGSECLFFNDDNYHLYLIHNCDRHIDYHNYEVTMEYVVSADKLDNFIYAMEAEAHDNVYGEASMYAEGMSSACIALKRFLENENYQYPYVPKNKKM